MVSIIFEKVLPITKDVNLHLLTRIHVGIIYAELQNRGFFPSGVGVGGKSFFDNTSGQGLGKYLPPRGFLDYELII